MGRVTGHVKAVERKYGVVWYMKYRDPSGHQYQRLLGPAHVGKGRPKDGYYTKRTAEDALQDRLVELRKLGPVTDDRTSGHTFSEACELWLSYVEHEQERRPSTIKDYCGVVGRHLLPEFGDTPLAEITTERIEDYRQKLLVAKVSRRTAQKILVVLFAILSRATKKGWLPKNPAEGAERVQVKRTGDFNVLEPAEVLAVARAADGLTAALVTVAAFTGLRLGELRALQWRDIDFAGAKIYVRSNFTWGHEGPPKSGKVRSVPLVDHAAAALESVSRRDALNQPGDLVFCNALGDHLRPGSVREDFYAALDAAGLSEKRKGPKPITFHDLRHSFGALAVQVWPLTDVQAYMGHQDIRTTIRYVHHIPRTKAAAELTAAIEASMPPLSENFRKGD